MTLTFRHRPVPPSPLARWDARWKLLALVLAVCGTAALNHVVSAAIALLFGLLLIVLARLPGDWVCGRLALFALAALPFVLVLPVTLAGEGWTVGLVPISERGVIAGVAVLFRGLAIGCFALVLLGTAPLHHTLAAAHRLRIPGLLVQLTLLAYRYTFLLADEMKRLRIAMRTRGFRMRANRHGYRVLGQATGALLVRAAGRADNVSAAMRCRGFDGTFHTLATFRTTVADVLAFLVLVSATIALVVWDRLELS